MIDINSYRSRIGNFSSNSRIVKMRKMRKIFRIQTNENEKSGVYILKILQAIIKVVMIFVLLQPNLCSNPALACYPAYPCVDPMSTFCLVVQTTAYQQSGLDWIGVQLGEPYVTVGKKQTSNYQARYLHGNRKRGILNMHVNIRSLYNKMSEVKKLILENKPHILGISEAELRKSHHSMNSLKVPGYDLLLPKYWEVHSKARLVVYVKKGVLYEHLVDIEEML